MKTNISFPFIPLLILLLGTLVVFLILGVSSKTQGAGNDLSPEKTYRTVIIENCEYIFVSRRPFSAEFSLTHKGNCTNHIK